MQQNKTPLESVLPFSLVIKFWI